MTVEIICPNLRCRKFLSVPEEMRGRLVKCRHCQIALRVPQCAQKTYPAAKKAG